MSDKNKTLNQRVLAWARGKKGQQVGSGECWDLADRALRHAGARSSTTTGRNDDYVWGDEVAIKDARPGDVLQFRDFVVKKRTDTEVTFGDGTVVSSWSEQRAVRGPTHTAIIDHVLGNGDIVVLEQHVKPLGKKVQAHYIAEHSRVVPVKVTHRIVLDEASGKYRPAKVSEKVTIEVSGKVRAYRPRAM